VLGKYYFHTYSTSLYQIQHLVFSLSLNLFLPIFFFKRYDLRAFHSHINLIHNNLAIQRIRNLTRPIRCFDIFCYRNISNDLQSRKRLNFSFVNAARVNKNSINIKIWYYSSKKKKTFYRRSLFTGAIHTLFSSHSMGQSFKFLHPILLRTEA
jgi:hypothetical protein